MRTVHRSLITLVVIFVPLLAVLWLGFQSVMRFIGAAERDLAPILAAEISRSLGRETTVQKVTIRGGYAYVDGLAVAEDKTFAVSEGRSFLSARRLILDFDLRKILLEKNPEIPLFTKVQVIEPVARLSRDHNGIWNFDDLLKQKREPAKRLGVGSLDVINGTVLYEDEAAPMNARRSPIPFKATLQQVRGNVEFNSDKSITAALTGTESTGLLRSFSGLGAYEPSDRRLYVRLNVEEGSIPNITRLLPPEHNLTAGVISGQLTYYRRPIEDGKFAVEYQADVSVQGGGFRTAQLASPITDVAGQATVTNSVITAKVDGRFAGSPIHAEGTVIGLEDPAFNGWASGKGVQLNRVLAALKLQDRYPALRQVVASADVRADIRGRPDALQVTASGTAAGSLKIPQGPTIPNADDLVVAFSGTLGAPRFTMSGTVPSIRFRQYEARNVWVSAVYTGKRAVADFRGQLGGGIVAGRVDMTPAGKRTQYSVIARARGVSLAALRLPTKQPLRGIVEGDVVARGRLDQTLPQGIARLRGTNIRYGSYVAHQAQARLRTQGDIVLVDRLVGRSATGYLVATGRVNVPNETVDLNVEANEVDLGMFPFARDEQGRRRLAGYVYVRDGRVTGPIDDPQFKGKLRGYGVASGYQDRVRLDLISASVSGNLDRITIDGDVYRFPEFAKVEGVILNPASKNARLALSGKFEGVELQDIATIAGSQIEASGTAEGSFTVTGTVSKPVVKATGIDVVLPTIGDQIFERMTASLEYDASGRASVLRIPEFAIHYDWPGTTKNPDAVIRGAATLTGGDRFTVHAQALNVPMDILDPVALKYARIRGEGDVKVDMTGRIQDGKPVDLNGTVRASTSEMIVNDQDFGDLLAVANLSGRRVTGSIHPLGPGGEFAMNEPGVHVSDFRYNLDEQQLLITGVLKSFELERLRLALNRSPLVLSDPQNVISQYLSPITRPLAGSLDVHFTVTGPAENPDTQITWNGQDMEIEGQRISEFKGDMSFNRKALNLQSARLIADETVVSAQGTYAMTGAINADLTLNNLPLRILRSWFPERKELAGLNGIVDHVDIRAEGTAQDLVLTGSAGMLNVTFQDPNPARHLFSGRVVEFPAIRSSNISYREKVLTLGDIAFTILEPEQAAPARPAPQVLRSAAAGGVDPRNATPESVDRGLPQLDTQAPQPRPTHEAHASATIGPFIEPPLLTDQTPIDVQLNIKEQGLGLIAAFLPATRVKLEGTIQDASLRYVGLIGHLTNPQAVTGNPAAPGPKITGRLALNADRISSSETTTEITDLAADIAFEGETLRVNRLVAKTQVVLPRGKPQKSEEISITGSLPVSNPKSDAALRVSAPKILIAEAPLPRVGSGAIAAEIGTDNLATPGVTESLTITGSLLNPRLSGTLYARNTTFQMPEAFPQSAVGGFILPLTPRFDLTFVAEKNVRIAALLLNAEVRTSETEPVTLTGTVDSIRLGGKLVIERGNLTFPTARFTIDRGSEIELRYPYYAVGEPDPSLGIVLDVTAKTRLSATSDITGQRRRYTITVEARGPLNDNAPLQITDNTDPAANPFNYRGLRLTFRSDPPDLASNPLGLQRKVTGILGGQEQIESLFAGRLNVGGVLSGFVSDVFLPGLFEQSGIGRILGLEEFEVETSALNAFSLRLTRQLFGPVYLTYWRRLSGVNQGTVSEFSDWEMRFSYRLPRNLQLTYTFNEQRQNAVLFEGVFRFR